MKLFPIGPSLRCALVLATATPANLKRGLIASGMFLFLLASIPASAFTLDDIQFWTGAGTNRAAMVIQWSDPEVRNNSNLPNPITDKTLVWGYHWNGSATGEDMFNAIAAADPRLFAVVSGNTAYGKAVFALGYDLNNNRLFGIRDGTNILAASSLTNAPSAFTNGLVILGYTDPDFFQSLDAADLYWSGWYGPNWELWHERGGNGGFTNAPDRGTNVYWTPDDPEMPFFGDQGEWHFSDFGMSGLILKDGSWMGWSVAAGGLDFGNPDDPGTIAWSLHKHAPEAPETAPTNTSPYAVELAASQGPFGPTLYNDPLCVLGEPTSLAVNSDPIIGTSPFHIKLVEPAYNRDIDDRKVIVTLNRTLTNGNYSYGSVTVKFDHPITDDPANPYGIDFEVFGNAFYVGSDYVSDASDMRAYYLVGGTFTEPMLVSVSPDGTNWYTYTDGPFCDTSFPTQGYEWDADQHDASGNGWTRNRMDFTKPVNPALDSLLGGFGVTLSAAKAIKLYTGSGGGTGFDLAESAFESIQYIRVSGAAGYYAGEVDAFSDVRPATLGETLCMAPENLDNGTAELLFQKPGAEDQNLITVSFSELDDYAHVATARLDDSTALATIPGISRNAIQLELLPVLGTNAIAFQADLRLAVGHGYGGDGNDLHVFQWNGTNWHTQAAVFDSGDNSMLVPGLTNLSTFVVAQAIAPALAIRPGTNGFDFQFVPVPNWTHVLERSTDWTNWTDLATITPTNTTSATLPDNAPPAGSAFYRLRLSYHP